MESDKLISTWKGITTPEKNERDLAKMLKENNHPILKAIKKQLIVEFVGFSIFMFCYYSMFDGEHKPTFVNIIIILAILFPLLHNLRAYQLQRKLKSSSNIKDDLSLFIKKTKSFALEAIIARCFFAAGVLTFFTYQIKFSESKWWALIIIISIITLQLVWLYSIWAKRINKLKLALNTFDLED